MSRTVFRGVTVDKRTSAMLGEVERLVGFHLVASQGSYHDGSLSAGTHNGGGAIDLSIRALTAAEITKVVRAMRTVGFAAWHRRSPEWTGAAHIHGIAVGCPDLDPSAARQVTSLRNGRNGLASNGKDRHAGMKLPVTTWEFYLAERDDKPAPKHAEAGSRDLKKGATGDDVKALQRLLGGLVVDGKFGPVTETAVKRYQRLRGIAQDGVVGPITWGHLLGKAVTHA
jgi:hypothetical protein